MKCYMLPLLRGDGSMLLKKLFFFVFFLVIGSALAQAQDESSITLPIESLLTDEALPEAFHPTPFSFDFAMNMGYSNYDGFQPGLRANIHYNFNPFFSIGAGIGYFTSNFETRTGPTAGFTLTYWRGEVWSAFLREEMNWYSIVDEDNNGRGYQADYINSILGFARELSPRISLQISLNYGVRVDHTSEKDNFSAIGTGFGYLY